MYRIAVTNRHLCEGDFLERIRQIAQGDEYNAILLREKDLSHEEYEELAKKVLKITNLAGKKCILHRDYKAALSLFILLCIYRFLLWHRCLKRKGKILESL